MKDEGREEATEETLIMKGVEIMTRGIVATIGDSTRDHHGVKVEGNVIVIEIEIEIKIEIEIALLEIKALEIVITAGDTITGAPILEGLIHVMIGKEVELTSLGEKFDTSTYFPIRTSQICKIPSTSLKMGNYRAT